MTAPALPITVTLGDLTEGTPDAPFMATAHYDETAGGLVVTSALAVHIPMVPPRCRKPRYQAFHTTATVVILVAPDHHRDVIQWEDHRRIQVYPHENGGLHPSSRVQSGSEGTRSRVHRCCSECSTVTHD